MKVIIAGGRTYANYNQLKQKCEEILIFYQTSHEEIEIISGMAYGADKLGAKLAMEKGWKLTQMPADWNKFGLSAGFKRNEEMAKYANEWERDLAKGELIRTNQPALIAFWDGESKGTGHIIDLAKKYNLKIHVIKY